MSISKLPSSKYLFIITRAPYTDRKSQDRFALALTAASLDQKVNLLFLGQGLWHLTQLQDGPRCGRKTYTALLKALSHYDIPTAYASEQDLKALGLTQTDLLIPVSLLDDQTITTLIHQHTYFL